MSRIVPGQTDVVVVGGGIMGMSTAYHLQRDTDLDVLVLEVDAIGSGSTGRSSGVIRFNYGEARIYSEMALRSYRFWTSAEEELGTDVGFRQNGILCFGSHDADFGELAGYKILRDLGVDVEKLDADECDTVAPHVSTDGYDYGIYCSEGGFADAYAANMAFYQNAVEMGASVRTGVEVTGFLTADGGDRVTGVETTDGPVRAESVVLAGGPWSKDLAATIDVDLPIVPTREQLIILSPDESFFEEYSYPFPTITSKEPGHVYFRPDPVDNVLVGGHHRGTETDPDHYDEGADMEYIDWAIDRLRHRSPPLTEADLIRGYSGLYSNTPDKDFIVDEPVENLVCLGGFSGHGFKHSPVIGEIATDLVTSGETDIVDLDVFSLSRFEEQTVDPRESL